jgi:hypothetical protein
MYYAVYHLVNTRGSKSNAGIHTQVKHTQIIKCCRGNTAGSQHGRQAQAARQAGRAARHGGSAARQHGSTAARQHGSTAARIHRLNTAFELATLIEVTKEGQVGLVGSTQGRYTYTGQTYTDKYFLLGLGFYFKVFLL